MSGDCSIVEQLLKYGANSNSTTMSGKTPLSIAVNSGCFQIVQLLLNKFPQSIENKYLIGSSLLMLAADSADVAEKKGFGAKMCTLLVDAGASVNEEDKNGHNALDRLCMTCGNLKFAKMLVSKGIKVRHEVDSKHSMNNLMAAALNGHLELCLYLIEECRIDPRRKNEVVHFN
jgi:ankyrin repeat protein